MARGMVGCPRLKVGLIALAGVAAGAGAAAVDPVRALAGRYSWHFENGDVTGATYGSDNVAEIVPVDPTHAYVRFELAFFNGHSCSLAGIAARQGDALVYRGLPDDTFGDEKRPCRLTIRRVGAKLTWDDGGTCKGHCGERGSFSKGDMAWSSKRPIRYMARLKGSEEYRDALIEWRTGKAAR